MGLAEIRAEQAELAADYVIEDYGARGARVALKVDELLTSVFGADRVRKGPPV